MPRILGVLQYLDKTFACEDGTCRFKNYMVTSFNNILSMKLLVLRDFPIKFDSSLIRQDGPLYVLSGHRLKFPKFAGLQIN